MARTLCSGQCGCYTKLHFLPPTCLGTPDFCKSPAVFLFFPVFFFFGRHTDTDSRALPRRRHQGGKLGSLMDTAFAPHLQQNPLLFYRTRKPPDVALRICLSPWCSIHVPPQRVELGQAHMLPLKRDTVATPGLHDEPSLHWLSGRGARQH